MAYTIFFFRVESTLAPCFFLIEIVLLHRLSAPLEKQFSIGNLLVTHDSLAHSFIYKTQFSTFLQRQFSSHPPILRGPLSLG